ncbi:MAG TPA: LysR family transcriptional regulator, partial [Pseudomonadota bacterium]|nr:LysR family transcriptional regulator [Pseudomonadota bacterium]
MDHLAAIRTFLRVAELESFSEAARQLRLPKSLVTKRVNYLEQHLGTPLLARTTRRVRLTESGSLYHPRALALVEELEALEQSLGEAHVQLRGLVRVSCPTSFGVRYLGPALSGFLCAHPNLTAEVLLNDRVVNPAEEGYDLVLTDHPMISGQFQEEPMCDLALVACAAPAYLDRTGAP